MSTLWSLLSSALAISVIVGATLIAAGGLLGIRAVVAAGAPTQYLLKQTTRLLLRILVWFGWAALLLGFGYWFAQSDEFWRRLFQLVPFATVLGWITLSFLWREQFRPGYLFAQWLPTDAIEITRSKRPRQPGQASRQGIPLAKALEKVESASIDLSGASLLSTMQTALLDARQEMKRNSLFEKVETNVVWDHLQGLSRDLKATIERAPLVGSFTVAELYSSGTQIGKDLALAGNLTQWGRLFVNPLWLLQHKNLAGVWLIAPQDILQREFIHWLHAEIYRMAYSRTFSMYAEQDLLQPSKESDPPLEHDDLKAEDASANSKPEVPLPIESSLRVAHRTWWFLWGQLLLPTGLYCLAASWIIVAYGGLDGLLVCALTWMGMAFTLRFSMAMAPWAKWLQELSLGRPTLHEPIPMEEASVRQELKTLHQDVNSARESDFPNNSQMGAHLLWALQHTWSFGSEYAGKQRDASRPKLDLEYNFYLPDFFLALEYSLRDLQELYNSDDGFARAFRFLNERGFNPHLEKLEEWLEPSTTNPVEEEPSALSVVGKSLETVLKVSQKAPDPRIAVTAKAVDWLFEKGKQLGQDKLHDLFVYIITEKLGWRMIQLFAHALPIQAVEVTKQKERIESTDIPALVQANRKKPKPSQSVAEIIDAETQKTTETTKKEPRAKKEKEPKAKTSKAKEKKEPKAKTSKAKDKKETKKETKKEPKVEAEPDAETKSETETKPGLKEDAEVEGKEVAPGSKKKTSDLKPEAQQMLKAFRKRRKK